MPSSTELALCEAGAFACPLACAGPMPIVSTFHEARGYGIVFDVANDSAELAGIANPAIEGFVAPERVAGQTDNPVGLASGRTLEPASNRGQRNLRCNQQVNVVGHDDPGMKCVEVPVRFASFDRRRHYSSDPCVGKPLDALPVSIQGSVFRQEGFAWCQERIFGTCGYTPMQPPGQEDWNSFGMDTRQSSSVFEHEGRRKRLPHSAFKARIFSKKI